MALFLGRVHPKKNVHFLIEAWARARVPSDWQLYIAGPCDGEYQQTLDGLVQKHGLEGKVRFVGMVTGADKTYLLQRADWFLLPSQQENFGVAVLEAMGCGCAVAVSDQVYIADYFPARSDVLPVEMDAWVDFLRHRMTDESRRQTQIAANQHIIPQFRMETVARAWAATMREVFQKSPA
jgi:glycosyltransferase involved in cell wall biosynthesis